MGLCNAAIQADVIAGNGFNSIDLSCTVLLGYKLTKIAARVMCQGYGRARGAIHTGTATVMQPMRTQ